MLKKSLKKILVTAGFDHTEVRLPYQAELWREQHPVWDTERCFQCGICFLCCPDGAVALRHDGYYEMKPQQCKGCSICAVECPNSAITMVPGP